jgi:hypothetical protein
MDIFNSINNLQSVCFFKNYTNWVKTINIVENQPINSAIKTLALSLSIFVLIGSISIFIVNDSRELIKNAYNALKRKNPTLVEAAKSIFIVGSTILIFSKCATLLKDIKNIKKIAAITFVIIGIGFGFKILNF